MSYLSRTRAAFVGVLIVLGCRGSERSNELPARFPGTPLAELDKVSLGMSADALQQARPATKFTPYSGFAEQLDGAGVAYGFPTGAVWKDEFLGIAPLKWVTHVRQASSAGEARFLWKSVVNDAVSEMGQPAKCQEIKGRSPGARAVWEAGGAWLEIAVRAGFQSGGGTIPDRVLTTASTGEDPTTPTDLVSTDCARLLSDTVARSP